MFSLCCRSLKGNGLNTIYSAARITSIHPSRTLHSYEKSARDCDSFKNAKDHLKSKSVPHRRNEIRWNSTFPPDFAVARTQLLESLKDIKLSDTKHAPPPIFWSGVAGLVPIVLPPLSFLVFGYSDSLATVQMTFAATISAFLSGTKYGTHVAHVDSAQWSNVVASILPQFVSFTGLLLPQMIGFPLIMASIALNGFIDLTSGSYAPWYKALRLALTVPVLASLLLTCIFKMFH
uniref:Transmembrane protein 69 n=2 Tax=Lygus hesperus TaxID=30085 RepID=A0A0A9WGZ0_LYGHE